VDEYLRRGRLDWGQIRLDDDEVLRRVVLYINVPNIVNHLFDAIRKQRAHEDFEARRIRYNEDHPVRSTGTLAPWATRKPVVLPDKCHLTACPVDSTWEAHAVSVLDHLEEVQAWVKNDHIGFEVPYLYNGRPSRYFPDFVIRLNNGLNVVVEHKGQRTKADEAKWRAMEEWVEAVNADGSHGAWTFLVIENPQLLEPKVKAFARGQPGLEIVAQ
jgi:type III restriction enzyme